MLSRFGKIMMNNNKKQSGIMVVSRKWLVQVQTELVYTPGN